MKITAARIAEIFQTVYPERIPESDLRCFDFARAVEAEAHKKLEDIEVESVGRMKAMDYDRSIHQNPDAREWARFFMDTQQRTGHGINEEVMVGWFANAMMAMHDHLMNNGQPVNGDHAQYMLDTKLEVKPSTGIEGFVQLAQLNGEIAESLKARVLGLEQQQTKNGCLRCNTPLKCAAHGCSPGTWPSEATVSEILAVFDISSTQGDNPKYLHEDAFLDQEISGEV